MFRCALCHFEVEADDIQLTLADARCVCVRCYGREVGDPRPTSPTLRTWLTAALTEAIDKTRPIGAKPDDDF